MATKPSETPEVRGDIAGMKIKWDDSSMKSSYANVCNVTSTRSWRPTCDANTLCLPISQLCAICTSA